MSDPLWFKDAVIYELHVKTFQDSSGDGMGDFRGLAQRLDFFTDLGVTALWLLPFYPSPLRDDGYDIADYYNVHPSYGTLDDFRHFLDAAHERGLRVITELVLNHTSDQNAWFQRARRAPEGSPERDFYVWTQDPRKYRDARIIFKDFETSNWTWDTVAKAYFWHRFYSHQPDLNFDNPAVHEELFRVIDFWLGMGVDGLRLDAVPYLYEREGTNCENLPETHAFLRKLRQHIDAKFAGRMLLAEANMWPEDAVAYFGKGDECHMEFHFPLMPRMFMALQMEDRYPIIDILEQTPAIEENCQWAIFLRNHDELTLEMVTDEERDYMYRVYAADPRARINLGIRRRLAPLLGNNRRKIELINSLLFSLPGTPIIYYGDEIGMGDNFYLGDRNGVRTPMQWTPDRNAGFSRANPQQLYLPVIIDPEYHYESVNVENQQRNLSSLYWWMRRMLRVRQQSRAFARGDITFIQPENAKVLAYVRRYEDEIVLAVANLSRFSQVAELDLAAYAGLVPVELFGSATFPEIKATPTIFTLGPHTFYWFALRPASSFRAGETTWTAPRLTIPVTWNDGFARTLEREVLPVYVPSCRWFGGKGRLAREFRISRHAPIGSAPDAAHLLAIDVTFADGLPDTYLLPVAFVDEEAARSLAEQSPQAVLAFVTGGALCDALHLPVARTELLRLIAAPPPGESDGGLGGSASARLELAEFSALAGQTRLLGADQSNTSITCGDKWFFKFYRKFERGPHPDVEITRFLSEDKQLASAVPYGGAVEWRSPTGDGVVGMLVGYTQNQGDGWSYTLDALARYFDRVLEARADLNATTATTLIGGVYLERARQLALRTAEMHLALASGEEHPDFAPEPFSLHYQRSLYQSMRSAAGLVFRQLGRHASHDAEVAELLNCLPQIDHSFARLLEHRIETTKIRIHGDFHLGQVLNTGKDFVIIDFEGEPRLALSERRLKRSPLRDVAGMLRSFDYAAAAALRRAQPDDAVRLAPWARAWVQSITAGYLTAYFQAVAGASFLPAKRSDTNLLFDVFQLHKAVYEIGYELSYRPEWASIPIQATRRLLSHIAPPLPA